MLCRQLLKINIHVEKSLGANKQKVLNRITKNRLKSAIPDGEEAIHYLETVNFNNKFNIVDTSGYIVTINFIVGVLLLRMLVRRRNVY